MKRKLVKYAKHLRDSGSCPDTNVICFFLCIWREGSGVGVSLKEILDDQRV